MRMCLRQEFRLVKEASKGEGLCESSSES
ncbi:hypothetical protein BIW11_04428 [Tropilaelaps mercedesae]|uniref:Uncharacterized protein n=1 Tax=Tropilaelaps mercedesae TaxID=418985 RepID=A0A1V9X6X1_9ACAR|nr:hypothetical protein BIW11_04428 [Tropilaelaps mercedesae]